MFEGIPIRYFICIEACADHAGLTAKLIIFGFDATGIDSKRNEHVPIAPVAMLDHPTAEGACELT